MTTTLIPPQAGPATTVPHFLNGTRTEPTPGEPIPVTSPLDGAVIGELHSATAAEIDEAVKIARQAFETWGKTPVKDRVQPLFRFKQLVEQEIGSLSELVTQENGKTVAESKAGIEKGLEVVEFATAMPKFLSGEILEVSRGVDCYTRLYPLGVTLGITPFNFPAMVPLWMFPIAIACGNTFLLKPSEQVPFTSLRLGELLKEAGLPDGVFNVVQGGRSTVEGLLDHPGIDAAAFVGSTPVAKAVYERGIAAGKRMLTLGGAKNHLVVVPDADVEVTARNVVSSFTGCAGQRCMAASVLVTVGDCDHVISAIAEKSKEVRAGIEMGSVISRKAKERIVGYIDRAEQEGVEILVDGRTAEVPGHENGWYVNPTILAGVEPDTACACDEIFGPVLSIIKVDTLEEAIAIENRNPFGNAASIYTTNGGIARRFEDAASAGMVGVNIGVPVPREPFSFGGWNDSKFGGGDITGEDGVRFWTKKKKVTKKWSAQASANWMS